MSAVFSSPPATNSRLVLCLVPLSRRLPYCAHKGAAFASSFLTFFSPPPPLSQRPFSTLGLEPLLISLSVCVVHTCLLVVQALVLMPSGMFDLHLRRQELQPGLRRLHASPSVGRLSRLRGRATADDPPAPRPFRPPLRKEEGLRATGLLLGEHVDHPVPGVWRAVLSPLFTIYLLSSSAPIEPRPFGATSWCKQVFVSDVHHSVPWRAESGPRPSCCYRPMPRLGCLVHAAMVSAPP